MGHIFETMLTTSSNDDGDNVEANVHVPLVEDFDGVDEIVAGAERVGRRRRRGDFLRRPLVRTSLGSSSASGVLTSCYCFCCCSCLYCFFPSPLIFEMVIFVLFANVD